MFNKFDKEYLTMMRHVLDNGELTEDRTGVGTRSIFSYEMRFDVSDGSIPLLTTKKMHYHSIIHELLWFLSGDTNIKYLQENGVRIWNEWADADGELGPVYGKQWRNFGGSVDQITNVIDQIKNNSTSRRLIVSSWDATEVDEMALPPCHCFFQFKAINGKLSLKLTQRSADVFLGVPFNIAQYSMLLHMVAQVTGLQAHELIWSGGDVHIYSNHIEQCETQLKRVSHKAPKLKLNPDIDNIFDFKYEDIVVENYISADAIKATVAV